MRVMMTSPIQKAEKFPAVRPARTFSDAPPSREAVTTSFTWPEEVEVKTFTTSGMIAPASVPQVMIAESFHHIVPSPRLPMRAYETRKVRPSDTKEVSHTRVVSGSSKFIVVACLNLPVAQASFAQYETTDAITITMRIAKIQTRSCTCVEGSRIGRR